MTPYRLAAFVMLLTWPAWATALAFAGVPRAVVWGALMIPGITLDLTQPDLPPET